MTIFGLVRLPIYKGNRIVAYYFVSKRFAVRYSGWLKGKRRVRVDVDRCRKSGGL